ncbi:hypothetical protein GJV85_05310 [Sulfurimonas aquatica]|uniref:Uncharacterized protein n=1 Tax=Sulfurimonas aquatica TaxID=2672570 RepID=A0A975AZQ2_9BACT|nr:hypothetical protein [Sulfurimonas aquatica]QSZ41547.1 hypothetical protein GJV85_05310 [Sulfurimonas aquatica]
MNKNILILLTLTVFSASAYATDREYISASLKIAELKNTIYAQNLENRRSSVNKSRSTLESMRQLKALQQNKS